MLPAVVSVNLNVVDNQGSGTVFMNDVAILGGGVVGLFTARRLAREGWRVTLFEARQLGATEDKSQTHIALQDSETPSEQTVPRGAAGGGRNLGPDSRLDYDTLGIFWFHPLPPLNDI